MKTIKDVEPYSGSLRFPGCYNKSTIDDSVVDEFSLLTERERVDLLQRLANELGFSED